MPKSNDNARLKCVVCNRTKGVHLFYKRSATKRGYSQECKACYKKAGKHENALDARLRKAFGISLDEYKALLSQQSGRCFVCRKRPGQRRLAVDHDHDRERTDGVRRSVRGILCHKCNQFLGHIGDDPEAGLRIAEYLTDPPAQRRTGLQ